jgi:hypothetical protein
MAKQLINIGTLPNDNTGDPIRDGGDKINDNFNEIYGAIGDGSTLSIDVSNPVNGEALIYNSSTGKFESNSIGAVLSTLTITDDSSSSIGIDLTTDQLDVTGGLGIVSSVTGNQLKLDIDQSIVITQTGTETLSNKTLDGLSNTFTNIPNSALVNSELTIMDSTSTTDTVALGETLHITGSNAITTSVANNVLTIDLAPVSKCTTLGTTVLELGCTTTCLEGLTCFDLASGAEMRLRGYHPLGSCNVAIGTTGDIPNASTARCNVSIGYFALSCIVDGSNNVAIGECVLCGISDGCSNVAIGDKIMRKASYGRYNVAVGNDVMTNMCMSNGCCVDYNLMLGTNLFRNGCNVSHFCGNIVLGLESGRNVTSDTNVIENIIIGRCNFIQAKSSWRYNVALGFSASRSATGDFNVAIGTSAGTSSLTGHQIAIGRSAASATQTCFDCWQCTGSNILTANNPPAVCTSYSGAPSWAGHCFGCAFQQTPNIALGNFAMACATFADTNIVIGHNAAGIVCNTSFCNVPVGLKDSVVLGNTTSMNNATSSSIVIGNRAFTCMYNTACCLCYTNGSCTPTYAESIRDVIIGNDAYQNVNSGTCIFGGNSRDNVIMGAQAGQYSAGMEGSVVIGSCAYQNSFGNCATELIHGIVAIGGCSLMSHNGIPSSEPKITVIGAEAGMNLECGCGVTLVGTNAYRNTYDCSTGIVAVGDNALCAMALGDAQEFKNNTVVGSNAAANLEQGCSSLARTGHNTIIGAYAGTSNMFGGGGTPPSGGGGGVPISSGPFWCSPSVDLEDGCNNIIIGFAAGPSTVNVDDEITIGNPANTKFRLPGLQENATDGQVLTHNASTGYLELQDGGGGTLNVIDDSSTAISITLSTEQLQIAGGAGITTSASGNTITISNSASGSLNVLDDSSSSISIDLGTESLTLVGGTGITTSASGNTVTIAKSSNSYSTQKFTGDESTSSFTLNQSGRTVDDVFVIVNGIVLVPTDDYTISGTTLTFVLAPAASSEIQVRYLPL